MSNEPIIIPPFFIVYPENDKLFSGEISFEQLCHRQILSAIRWFAVALAIFLLGWLLDITNSANPTSWAIFLPIGIFLLIPFRIITSALKWAWIYRRFVQGQFLDGEIIHDTGYLHEGRQPGFYLYITYALTTPTGKYIERNLRVLRNDLLGRAPEAGTPLKVRYVDDRFFRVM